MRSLTPSFDAFRSLPAFCCKRDRHCSLLPKKAKLIHTNVYQNKKSLSRNSKSCCNRHIRYHVPSPTKSSDWRNIFRRAASNYITVSSRQRNFVRFVASIYYVFVILHPLPSCSQSGLIYNTKFTQPPFLLSHFGLIIRPPFPLCERNKWIALKEITPVCPKEWSAGI